MDPEIPPAAPIDAPKEPDPRHTPTVQKKRRVGMNQALAILAVHERKKVSYHVDYRAMAPRYNMGAAALRKLYCWWVAGRLELPPDILGSHSKADDRELIVRAREMARRDLALSLAAYEGAIFTAEDAMGKKGRLGKKRSDEKAEAVQAVFSDVRFMRREVVACMELVALADSGFDEYLQAQQAEMLRQKAANPAVPIPPEVQGAVRTLNDHERGLEALRAARAKAEPVELEVLQSNG